MSFDYASAAELHSQINGGLAALTFAALIFLVQREGIRPFAAQVLLPLSFVFALLSAYQYALVASVKLEDERAVLSLLASLAFAFVVLGMLGSVESIFAANDGTTVGSRVSKALYWLVLIVAIFNAAGTTVVALGTLGAPVSDNWQLTATVTGLAIAIGLERLVGTSRGRSILRRQPLVRSSGRQEKAFMVGSLAAAPILASTVVFAHAMAVGASSYVSALRANPALIVHSVVALIGFSAAMIRGLQAAGDEAGAGTHPSPEL